MSHTFAGPGVSLRPAATPGARTFSAAAVARRRALLLILHVVLVLPVAAQQATPEPTGGWTRSVAHYGKWVTAAAAIGLTALAVREHDQSAVAWDRLLLICRTDNADCAVGPDGRYLNNVAEGYYQRSLFYDARARRRLIAGQVALVAAAALFITDLARGPGGPPNIPFDPNKLVVAAGPHGGAMVGVKLDF